MKGDEKNCGRSANPLEMPMLLTIGQAAALLNVSDKHVRDLCHDGEIRAVKVGSAWRVNRDYLIRKYGLVEELESWLVGRHAVLDPVGGGEIVVRIELPQELIRGLTGLEWR